jgi:hypothetical protein
LTAKPINPSHALNLLVSWAVTLDQPRIVGRMDEFDRRRQEPLADSRSSSGIAGRGTMARGALASAAQINEPVLRGKEIPEPVTNQVTTAAGNSRRSTTHPDTEIHMTCTNPTQGDAIRCNRHAW